uniref:Uncharacterized protein n=1 Tax=Aegilops tauschii subsp. strangulata TaxID=200361 RepID=A0A453H539_AEGTS
MLQCSVIKHKCTSVRVLELYLATQQSYHRVVLFPPNILCFLATILMCTVMSA